MFRDAIIIKGITFAVIGFGTAILNVDTNGNFIDPTLSQFSTVATSLGLMLAFVGYICKDIRHG